MSVWRFHRPTTRITKVVFHVLKKYHMLHLHMSSLAIDSMNILRPRTQYCTKNSLSCDISSLSKNRYLRRRRLRNRQCRAILVTELSVKRTSSVFIKYKSVLAEKALRPISVIRASLWQIIKLPGGVVAVEMHARWHHNDRREIEFGLFYRGEKMGTAEFESIPGYLQALLLSFCHNRNVPGYLA